MNEAPNNMTTGRDDEVTFDPEETSAADGQWLAELRASAKSSKQSMRELLDDETVGAGDDTMAEIREAVRAARPTEGTAPAPVERLEPSTPEVRVEPHDDSAPETFAPPVAPDLPQRPDRSVERPTPPRSAPAASATTATTAPAAPSAPAAPAATTAPRWEPPPRLAPTIAVEPTVRLVEEDRATPVAVRLAAIAAVTLVAIVIVALVWSRTGDAPAEPPTDSSVVLIDPDAPATGDPTAPPTEDVEE